MILNYKKTVALILLILFSAVSYFAGRWSTTLEQSIKAENDYPWDLHRKIGSANLGCEAFRTAAIDKSFGGKFVVQPLDSGAVLVLATRDSNSSKVTAFSFDASGRIATDYWSLDCK